MKYQNWLDEVPKEIKNDAVWNLKVYRTALFLSDLCWEDAQKIIDNRFFSLADQLYDATGPKGIREIPIKRKPDFMK